jgi:hypothetical protein
MNMTTTITLEQIRNANPCKEGWKKLLSSVGSATSVSIGDIAISNGAQDALWATRCLPSSERRNVIRCIMPAVKRASTHTTDARVAACISALERWLEGDDTVDLKAAAYAADAAAYAARADRADRAAEEKQQIQDIIAVYPATI